MPKRTRAYRSEFASLPTPPRKTNLSLLDRLLLRLGLRRQPPPRRRRIPRRSQP